MIRLVYIAFRLETPGYFEIQRNTSVEMLSEAVEKNKMILKNTKWYNITTHMYCVHIHKELLLKYDYKNNKFPPLKLMKLIYSYIYSFICLLS